MFLIEKLLQKNCKVLLTFFVLHPKILMKSLSFLKVQEVFHYKFLKHAQDLSK